MSLFFKNRHPRSDLSAYIDGQMTPSRATTVEAHLASCEECIAELTQLRELRSALRSTPEVRAPRSFALTPDQVTQKVRPNATEYRPASLVTGLRLGSAGLAMALAVVVAIDAGGGTGEPGANDAAFEQAAATDSRSLEDDMLTSEGYEATATPPPGGAAAPAISPETDEAVPVSSSPATRESPTATGGNAVSEYGDDGSKGADDGSSPIEVTSDTLASDGDKDLLTIEIILGITAALVLLASFYIARSRRQSS